MMEITNININKKLVIRLIKVVIGLLIIAMCLCLFIVFGFFFGDISQYKQIGDTNFYLRPNEAGKESILCHNGGVKGISLPIYHEGLVHDVYWNHQVIIIKCSEQNKEHWYIVKNVDDYNYSDFHIKHFLNETEYRKSLDSLRLCEENMKNTNGAIPWSLHLWD